MRLAFSTVMNASPNFWLRRSSPSWKSNSGRRLRQCLRLRSSPPIRIGLSEWAAHPALGTPELQAIEPESWQAHPTDLDFLISQEAREIIEQEGIVLLSYKPLQQVWQERCSSTT